MKVKVLLLIITTFSVVILPACKMRRQVQMEQAAALVSTDSVENRLYQMVRKHRAVTLEQIQLFTPDSLQHQGIRAITRIVVEEKDSLQAELSSKKATHTMEMTSQKEELQSERQAVGSPHWYIVIILFLITLVILWNKRFLFRPPE